MRNAFLIAVLSVAVSSQSRAGVPSSFSVQGVLRNGSGMLQSSTINVLSNFYDSQMGGTKIAGPYSAQNVPAVNGLFTVTFSDPMIIKSLSGSASGQMWLELTVGNDVFPRQQVTPGIAALMCQQADSANAIAGVTVDATPPTDGQALVYSAVGSKWSSGVSLAKGGLVHHHPLGFLTGTTTRDLTGITGEAYGCALCPVGAVPISGSCHEPKNGGGFSQPGVAFLGSWATSNAWCCGYNNSNQNAFVEIESYCLPMATGDGSANP